MLIAAMTTAFLAGGIPVATAMPTPGVSAQPEMSIVQVKSKKAKKKTTRSRATTDDMDQGGLSGSGSGSTRGSSTGTSTGGRPASGGTGGM
jgi:hypothetical protein